MSNKRKILNDPVYGFVKIPNDLIYDLLQHPYFQRLRRVKQLGLTDMVYPGAIHTRFQHAIGAMHLMTQALNTLESKGILIMDVEREAAQIAILLHDIGHGPFSHVLEQHILDNVHHESITELVMEDLNQQFNGALSLAIQIFKNKYHRKFFHQLVSSQLDMDRMDYINRDSYFTGVAEGNIGVERIIKMLDVKNELLMVEEKGLLSVENFLNARRMMYWQVYLHKTAISAEVILVKALERVKDLQALGKSVFCPPALAQFLFNKVSLKSFLKDNIILKQFLNLDDTDIWYSMKEWASHSDFTLSYLAKSFLFRNLFKIKIADQPFQSEDQSKIDKKLLSVGINPDLLKYFSKTGKISNSAYIPENSSIQILLKSGEIKDVSEASDLPTIKALGKIVEKYYLCWSKDLYLQHQLNKADIG